MQFIKNIPIIGKLATKVYRKLRRKHIFNASYWIGKYIPNEKLSVIQIGSNDGISGDPLYQHVKKNKLWNVLFVEPVPYIFEQLKQNYGSEARFKFENAAINQDGVNQFFYTVGSKAFEEDPNLDSKYNQIGSFNKEQVLKLSQGVIDQYIEEIEVNCLTINQLFEKNNIETVDLLHIDAEGYDWKVLSQLNLNKVQPVIIAFEFLNLSEKERTESIQFLAESYYIFAFRIDYFCIRKDKIKAKDFKSLETRLMNT